MKGSALLKQRQMVAFSFLAVLASVGHGQPSWVQGKPFAFTSPGANYSIADQPGESREFAGWAYDRLDTWEFRPGLTYLYWAPPSLPLESTAILIQEFAPILTKNANSVHASWPDIGLGPYYVQVKASNGAVLTSSWVSLTSFDFTVPEFGDYSLEIAPSGHNFKSFAFRTSDYVRTRMVTPWFPHADTTKRTITFSFEPDPDDVAYYFQLYGTDGTIFQSQYIYTNSVTFTLSPGSYKWRVTPFTKLGGSYAAGPEMEWVYFSVKSSIVGMETLVGRDPLADSGPSSAALSYPGDSLKLSDGRLIISDSYHHVLKILDRGVLSVFAGTGVAGYNGDGNRTQVQLNLPGPLTLGTDGAVYFGDCANYLIRRIDLSTGLLSTVTGIPQTVGAADANGTPLTGAIGFVSQVKFHSGVLTFSAQYVRPGFVAISKIYQVNSGVVTILPEATNLVAEQIRGYDWSGTRIFLIRVNGANTALAGSTVNGGWADLETLTNFASGVATLNPTKIVYGNHTELRVFSGGSSSAYPVSAANISSVKMLSDGTLDIVDTDGGRVFRFDPSTSVTTPLVVRSNSPFSTIVDVVQESPDSVLILCNSPSGLFRYSLSTGAIQKVGFSGGLNFSLTGISALRSSCRYPTNIAIDPSGDIFFSEQNAISRISARTGTIFRFAGSAEVSGFQDNVDRLQARFASPRGISVDFAGNLLVSDSANNRIRFVDRQTGRVSTVAGNGTIGVDGEYGNQAALLGVNHPLAVLPASNGYYIAQSWRNSLSWVDAGNVISRAAGIDISTGYQGGGAFAEGYRLSAAFNTPFSIHPILSFNDLLVADQFNNRIRRVNSYVTTVAGDGRSGYSSTTLNLPSTALFVAGNVIIADTGNGQLRSIRLP